MRLRSIPPSDRIKLANGGGMDLHIYHQNRVGWMPLKVVQVSEASRTIPLRMRNRRQAHDDLTELHRAQFRNSLTKPIK